MTNTRRNGIIKVLSAVLTLLICLFVTFSFVGCDEEASVVKTAYRLYLLGCAYDEPTLTVTAYVSLSGKPEQLLDGLRAEGERRFSKDGLFYNKTDTYVSLDAAEIFEAVLARDPLTRETTVIDESGVEKVTTVKYQRLQVALRYDTIYKSIVTSGVRHPNGAGYTDIFQLGEDGVREFTISQRTQNSANWYSLLIAAGIVLFAALTAGYLAYLHKHKNDEA